MRVRTPIFSTASMNATEPLRGNDIRPCIKMDDLADAEMAPAALIGASALQPSDAERMAE